jgi:hypothetical protein
VVGVFEEAPTGRSNNRADPLGVSLLDARGAATDDDDVDDTDDCVDTDDTCVPTAGKRNADPDPDPPEPVRGVPVTGLERGAGVWADCGEPTSTRRPVSKSVATICAFARSVDRPPKTRPLPGARTTPGTRTGVPGVAAGPIEALDGVAGVAAGVVVIAVAVTVTAAAAAAVAARVMSATVKAARPSCRGLRASPRSVVLVSVCSSVGFPTSASELPPRLLLRLWAPLPPALSPPLPLPLRAYPVSVPGCLLPARRSCSVCMLLRLCALTLAIAGIQWHVPAPAADSAPTFPPTAAAGSGSCGNDPRAGMRPLSL